MAGVDPHFCPECPRYRYPKDRPPTKLEVVQKWMHHHADWPRAKVLRFAVEDYVHQYRVWVNTRRWRKPPEWVRGRVPLHELRGKLDPMTVDEAARWRRELLAKLERSLSGDSTV